MHSERQGTTVPTIILCGGKGTRIREAGELTPKPMLTVGGKPILWHIMKTYAAFGFTDFVLALGYLGNVIRSYFLDYEALSRDFTVEIGAHGSVSFLQHQPDEGWRVTCMETGAEALTGTRVRRAAAHIQSGPVMVTYGDGVGDIDVRALLEFHRGHGGKATLTTVNPPGRFGELHVRSNGQVESFEEKPQVSGSTINGGFMVLEREAIDDYIPADRDVMLEREPLNNLARDGELWAYPHTGFWQSMDTARERDLLERLWKGGGAPWKVWP